MRTALITGVAGLTLAPREAAFLKEARPAGLILFARNLEEPRADPRAGRCRVRAPSARHELLVLIDQEGGRVQRLRPPLGRSFRRQPPSATIPARPRWRRGRLLSRRAAARGRSDRAGHQHGLRAGARPAGARSPRDHRRPRLRHRRRRRSIALGQAVAEGFMAGGVLPVIKHIPGHGRAKADSHLALPVVTPACRAERRRDFRAVQALSRHADGDDGARGFRGIDPEAPASTSARSSRARSSAARSASTAC